MTWPTVLATGSGALEFRLQIEGYQREWVTAVSMAGNTSDTPARIRCDGLQREGIILNESANLKEAKLRLGTMTLQIADIDGAAALEFSRKPTKVTWLRTTISASATNVPVASTDGWTTSDQLNIGTETMDITALVDADDFTATRAIWSTIAQKHWAEDGERLRAPMVTNFPQCMEGRRCRIYAYAAGDDMTGGGTPIWIGVVATEPVLTGGTTWEISIDPLTRLLQADVGEDLEQPATPRGIYYPFNAALLVSIGQAAGASGVPTNWTDPIHITGFYATQEAFCAALTTKLAAAATAAGMTGTFAAVPTEDGGWQFTYTTPAATPLYAQFDFSSVVDGPGGGFLNTYPTGDAAARVGTVVAETTYYTPPSRSYVPRGAWGNVTGVVVAGDAAAAPRYRVYLGGTITIDGDMTAAQVRWPDGTEATHVLDAAGYDDIERYVEVLRPGFGAAPLGATFMWPGLPRFKFGRRYGADIDGVDFADFLTSVCTDAPNYANIGAVPFITFSDFDDGVSLAITAAVVAEAAAGRAFLTHRRYFAFGAMSLEDWIAEDCKLYGIFPCLNSSGRLTFRRLKQPVPTEIGAAEIAGDETLMDGGFPGWEPNAVGMTNTVIIRTGYDPVEDKHTGDEYKVRDVPGFGINRAARVTEIAPMSAAVMDETTLTIDQIYSVASPILSVFGAPYWTITVEVPLLLFGVLLGDVVTIVSPHLPDPETGTRGWTEPKATMVVGRHWDMGTGRGTLRLLGHAQNLTGYAPNMRVTGDVINDPGTNLDHTLTVSGSDVLGNANAYIPAGSDATNWFAIGDKIRLVEWDATVPDTGKGTVTAVTATTVRVTLNSGHATFAATTYLLGFDSANTGSIATRQKAFCFLAGTDGLIDFPGDARSARLLGL